MNIIENINNKLINLFGENKTNKLMYFMKENGVIPINIIERSKIDDRNRYIISTAYGKIELNNNKHIIIPIKIYVTYNKIKNNFTYMVYLSNPL